mgnify:FL=1
MESVCRARRCSFGTDPPLSQTDVILGFLLNSLEQEEPEAVATAVVGIAKLMLSGVLTDEEVRRSPLVAACVA